MSRKAHNLHSGRFGRVVHESMTGVISLMSKLVAPASAIVVPGVDDVLPIADAEEQRATLCMSIEPVTDISL